MSLIVSKKTFLSLGPSPPTSILAHLYPCSPLSSLGFSQPHLPPSLFAINIHFHPHLPLSIPFPIPIPILVPIPSPIHSLHLCLPLSILVSICPYPQDLIHSPLHPPICICPGLIYLHPNLLLPCAPHPISSHAPPACLLRLLKDHNPHVFSILLYFSILLNRWMESFQLNLIVEPNHYLCK